MNQILRTFPTRAETVDQQLRITVARINIEIAKFALEEHIRSLEAARSQIGCGHAAFRGSAHVQPFHHAAVAGFCKSQQSRTQRSGNADRHRGLMRVMLHDTACGYCRSEHAGLARRMEAHQFAGLLGCEPSPQHALVSGNERR